jgi:hypothetical protein
LRRRIWISSIAIIVVSVSILFVLYVHISLSSAQGTNVPSNLASSGVAPIGQYYLSKPPYSPDNSNKLTKIFLENATLQYGYSNISFTEDRGYDNFEGVEAVIVNATVRNDYSISEIIQFSEEGTSQITLWLDVYLYDKEGDLVDTLHQGNPFKGSVQLDLKSGETTTVNLMYATPNRNIDYFEIYVSYLPNVQI